MVSSALVAALLTAAPAAAQDVPIQLQRGEVLLQVEADGEHRARPDTMWISAGVVTTGRTAAEAMDANSVLAQRPIARIRELGIEVRDVQTSRLSLRPRIDGDRERDSEASPPVILGYVAENTLSLTLRDLARAADIIPALLQAGANEVNGPRFSFSDPRPMKAAAERAAIAAAREEAGNYASALGMRVARIVRVRDRRVYSEEDGETITVTGSRIQRPVLEPGELRTGATVWVDFALAPQ